MMHSILIATLSASAAYLVALAAATLVLALRAGGRREIRVEDHDVLSESRFTIPVSLIVRLAAPLQVSIERASDTVAAALALNYPELEVIVVAEDLAEADWSALKIEWQLDAREFFYRQSLTSAPVRMVYRSARDARLMVVDKSPVAPDRKQQAGARAADALNCGVNLARYRYVCAIDPALVFDADALLRAMTAPMRDPAVVVGATSHMEVADQAGLASALQRLASLRAIMESRVIWAHLHIGFGPRDGVVVWRRDAIVQSGGFSLAAADADYEMMLRLQTSAQPGVAGRVVRTSEVFGRVDPRSFVEDFRRTARRQRASVSAILHLPAKSSTLYYVLQAEVITPLVQAWLLTGTAAGVGAGWLSWRHLALAFVLLSFGRASLAAAALLIRGSQPGSPDEQASSRLLLAAPLECIVAGTAAGWARTAGALAFSRSSSTHPPHGARSTQ
jgi:hypothetical protein